jgi:hypothetical protein
MKIARIDKKTNIVVNLEECDLSWIEDPEQKNNKDFIFINDDNELAQIGFIWDGESYQPNVEG